MGQDKVNICWLSCDSSDPDVTSWAEVFRRYVTTKVEVYQKILAEMASQDIGLEGKNIAAYVRQQQALYREERAAWREEKRRADEVQMIQINQTEPEPRPKLDKARIEHDTELVLKELELKAQAQPDVSLTGSVPPPPHHKDTESPKLPNAQAQASTSATVDSTPCNKDVKDASLSK